MFEEEVVYFGDSPEQKWFVKFKDVHFTRDHILDLCIYNDDGIAKFESNASVKETIRPSLINRYTSIEKQIKDDVKKGENLLRKMMAGPKNNNASNELMEMLFRDDLFRGKYERNNNDYTVVYNCKRIGRLDRTRATGLLMSYTSIIQRPAYEMDFGRLETSSS